MDVSTLIDYLSDFDPDQEVVLTQADALDAEGVVVLQHAFDTDELSDPSNQARATSA